MTQERKLWGAIGLCVVLGVGWYREYEAVEQLRRELAGEAADGDACERKLKESDRLLGEATQHLEAMLKGQPRGRAR
jgi:hypothetical protein